MIAPSFAILLGAATLVSGLPAIERRVVTALNAAAFAEAQQRDATATRAFSAVQIQTGTGQCLFVDELSGDFRANLTPIQVAACNSSTSQQWDVITSGKHNNVAGAMLVVSAQTQACMNFDPRRAAGNQVILFACGGRADGQGQVTNSQLFPFSGGAGPLALAPENQAASCFTVKGNVVDIAACNTADPNQSFTFGSGSTAAGTASATASGKAAAAVVATPSAATVVATSSAAAVACGASPIDTATSSVIAATVAAASAAATTVAASKIAATTSVVTTALAATTTAAPQIATAAANPTSVIAVSRAGVVLNPSAAAEANVRDDTATRAFTSIQVKSANGQCLFIDPTAGDFRENLIPIQLKACDGSANEKFDFITAGKHNNAANSTLVVSSLTNGCLNFDSRRAAGDTVIMFACGGRADGQGLVTNSQLFTFTAGATSLRLQPENANGATCLVPNASGRLDQVACSTDPGQLFTIG